MNSKPRRSIFLISRLALTLAAVFSGINIVFALCQANRLMPMALTMTGYLTRVGVQIAQTQNQPFFAAYCAVLAGVVCLAFMLCVLLAVKNRGWLTAAALIFFADCAGIAVLFITGGYKQGYWFEMVGHGVILVLLILAFCALPQRSERE